jgi:predicted thioesterase
MSSGFFFPHGIDRASNLGHFPPPTKRRRAANAAKESEMKDSLRPGVSRVERITVDRDRTISFMGEEARVYATPRLVSDVEMACRNLILEHADPGEDSVGMEIALKHLAPSLPGMTVEIAVRVAAVDRRKVSFEVTARDELDEISAGNHVRFVVDVAKTIERVKAKAAQRDARKA